MSYFSTLLKDCKTKLKFDNYISDYIPVENRIGQSNPLSMILYLFYNADLLEIPQNRMEVVFSYIDNIFLFAEGVDFKEMHGKPQRMMKKEMVAMNSQDCIIQNLKTQSCVSWISLQNKNKTHTQFKQNNSSKA